MAKYATRRAYGDAEGPFGFPMPSRMASEVETLYKGLPQDLRDMGLQRRTSVAQAIDLHDGERADISLVTNDAVDRDHEVVMPSGGDWSQFRKNPVVTFAHHYDELPVGRALWVKRVTDEKTNGWLAKTQYTTRPESWDGQWFPDAVWHFVKSGDLRGKSIGFLPLKGSPPEEKEIKARPELAGVRFIIRKWLALEYAVAPVQSNPDAFVVAAAKARDSGLPTETILNETGLIFPTEIPTFTQYLDSLSAKKPLPTPSAGENEADLPKRIRARRVFTAEDVADRMRSIDIGAHVREEFNRLKGRV